MNCIHCCCTKIAYYLLCIGVSLVSRHSVEKSAVNGSLILAILYRIFLKHFIGTRVKIVHQRLKRYLKVIFITRSVTSQRIWSVQSLKNMNWFKIASNISQKKELIKIKIAQLSTKLQDSYFYITVDLCSFDTGSDNVKIRQYPAMKKYSLHDKYWWKGDDLPALPDLVSLHIFRRVSLPPQPDL